LSRFLADQFLVLNGFVGLNIQYDFDLAYNWLNSARDDFVNNAPDDNSGGTDPTNGCTTLFIYYLFHQLGFSIKQIVGAGGATLTWVYRNLTGDTYGDPFPFFKRLLDNAFPPPPPGQTVTVPGPIPDDPWPLGMLSFVFEKNSFGKDEVTDQLTPPNNGVFPSAFWLVLEGFNRQVLGGNTPTLSGQALGLTGVTLPADVVGTEYEQAGDYLALQLLL
jgi:hypothetical protein